MNASQPLRASLSIGVVLVAWDPVAARSCAHALSERLEQIAPATTRVFVDNRGSGMEWTPDEGFELIAGDNSAREFSGLDRGIEHLRAVGAPDVWVLANDRYQANDPSLLDYFDGGTLEAVASTRALSGRINRFPSACRSFGYEIVRWACSSFLVVSDDALERLRPLVEVGEAELERVMGPARGETPLLDPEGPLDERHRNYLTEWLTGEGDSLSQRWYRSRAVDAESWDDLRGKVQSILNEHLLSARAREAGIPVLPLSLAFRLGQLSPSSPVRRTMERLIEARPETGTRILKGTVGGYLFAVDARLTGKRPG